MSVRPVLERADWSEGWSIVWCVCGRGVSVLVVMRLQVLANDTTHLQCAKLKVREVSGGRNRAGAGLVSRAQHFPPPPARGALCLLPPSPHLLDPQIVLALS